MAVSVNVIYGKEEFKKLFEPLIDEKINDIICRIKDNEELRYNDIDYLSTKDIEVEKNE